MFKYVGNTFAILLVGIIWIGGMSVECLGAEDQFKSWMNLPDCLEIYSVTSNYHIADERLEKDTNQLIQVVLRDLNEIIWLWTNVPLCLYFPKNAKQPSTKDAIQWSCANVDSHLSDEQRLTSPTTEWYMKIFGVIPYKIERNPQQGYFIEAGFDEFNKPKRIISYDQETMESDNNEITDPVDTKLKTKKQFFIDNFRKIASTPVGRVLLYRLLIEIRREDHNRDGCFETYGINIKNVNEKKNRNVLRCSAIASNPRESVPTILFVEQLSTSAGIYISEKPTHSPLIGMSVIDMDYTCIIFGKETFLDVNLFHELGHWFHYLRDYQRTTLEKIKIKLLEHNIGKYYWGDLEGRESHGRVIWSNHCWGSDEICNFEEMRNILGSSIVCDDHYLEGDDLCENLYRLCIKQPLRFGHKGRSGMNGNFFEDIKVINKVKLLALNNISKYMWNYSDEIYVNEFCDQYNFCQKQGLGKFKCGLVIEQINGTTSNEFFKKKEKTCDLQTINND